MLTEGVICYFSVHDTSLLATDLFAVPSITLWVQDFDNSGGPAVPRGWAMRLKSAPFLFAVKDWFEFFKNYGWESSTIITSFEESTRINRPYPLDFPYGMLMRALPKEWCRKILSLSGVVVMKKSGNTKELPPSSSVARHARAATIRAPFQKSRDRMSFSTQ